MSLKEINLLYKKFDRVHGNVNQDLDLLESGQTPEPQTVCYSVNIHFNTCIVYKVMSSPYGHYIQKFALLRPTLGYDSR